MQPPARVRQGRWLMAVLALLTGAAGARDATPPATPAALSAPTPGGCHDPAPPERYSTAALAVWRDCADTPELVSLPAGRFLMGESGDVGLSYELPVREVQVAPFALGRYEVTFLEWDACVADGFCLARPDDRGWGRGFHPVINVSWVDAQQFVAWLSRKTGQPYRLPSEAEWEYAARAGSAEHYYWGDSSASVCEYANAFDISGQVARPRWHWSVHCFDGYAYTAPVGSFPPNPWGLYDMQGNVWEWVQDCWHSDYTGAPADSSPWIEGGECNKRVNRGGGWGNHPRTLRAAKRDGDAATAYGDAFGFRVVRELPAPVLSSLAPDAGAAGDARP